MTAIASDFYDGEEKIASENIKVNFLKKTSAHISRGDNHGAIPKYPKENIPDIISRQETVSIDAESVQPVWLEINVLKDAKAGTYQGAVDFTVSGKAKPIKVPYSFEEYTTRITNGLPLYRGTLAISIHHSALLRYLRR